MTAVPVLVPGWRRSSRSSSGPAAAWMAPSTPPPPRKDSFAALTMASTATVVMSPLVISIIHPLSRGRFTAEQREDLAGDVAGIGFGRQEHVRWRDLLRLR